MAKAPSKETFIVDCPVCKAKVAAEEEGRAEQFGFNDQVGEPYGYKISVGKCPRCKTLIAGTSEQVAFENWEGEEEDAWSEPVRVYPEPPKIFSSHRIPYTVTASLSEGANVLQANAPIAACVMFGRALEAVCRDVLFTPEEKKAVTAGTNTKRLMLAEGIKQLKEKNIIDDRLYDWSQQLHAFRNIAAHPEGNSTSISRQDAEDLKTFVYAIIEYIYDLADRYEQFKRRQARRVKENKDDPLF